MPPSLTEFLYSFQGVTAALAHSRPNTVKLPGWPWVACALLQLAANHSVVTPGYTSGPGELAPLSEKKRT